MCKKCGMPGLHDKTTCPAEERLYSWAWTCPVHGDAFHRGGSAVCCFRAAAVCTPVEGPEPDWATGPAKFHTDLGAQLCTRDGRKMGNACIICSESHQQLGIIYLVLTDAGNLLRMTNREILELFYLPQWCMDPEGAPGWAHFDDPPNGIEDLKNLVLAAKQVHNQEGA